MLFSFSNLVEVSLGGGSRINVCSTSLNFLNTHQPVRDCIYGSNTISVKKYICWSNITLVRYCMYLLVIYNLGHKIHLLFKYNLGQILYNKDRYQEQAFFCETNFSCTEAGPFFQYQRFWTQRFTLEAK